MEDLILERFPENKYLGPNNLLKTGRYFNNFSKLSA